jgi:predicted N-acyltransferase
VRDLVVRTHGRVREIPRATWDALAGDDASPFVEWTWLDCLEEAGCVGAGTGWSPCHLTLWDAEALVAAAPAYVKTNSEGEFIFDWAWADASHRMGIPYYPKLLVGVPFTPVTGQRLLVAAGRERAAITAIFAEILRTISREGGLSSAHVLFLPAADVPAWTAAGMLPRKSLQYHFSNPGYEDFEDFLRTLPSKKRTQIRRERAQPARDGITIETLDPGALTPDVAATMHDLYTTTVDRFMWGRRYLNRAFFELVAARFAPRLAWVVARERGAVVAGAFNVEKGQRLYGRYWGTFVDRPFLHFNVCYYHGIDRVIARGLEAFEPGAGGEHKRVRGFAPRVMSSVHHLESARLRRLVEPFLAREAQAILAHLTP